MTRGGHCAIGADVSPLYIFGGAGACALALAAGLSLRAGPAWAIPSFARQTGQPCATCHNGVYPQLTPYGRQFKLNGYTAGGTRCRDYDTAEAAAGSSSGTNPQIPLAVMLQSTFTHIQKDLPAPPVNVHGNPNGLGTNNVAMEMDTSVFYGGQIYCRLGAMLQATYDRNGENFFQDNSELRYADKTKLAGIDLLYGALANNNPTMQDVWNTTPAWGYPFITSTIAAAPPGTMIEKMWPQKVAGIGGYVFANNMFYAELTGYRTYDRDILGALGQPTDGTISGIDGVAPYWRLAVEKTWNEYSLMFGTFGMQADVVPDVSMVSPTNKFTDVAFDSQFQWISDVHAITARATYIYEWQKLDASFLAGTATNPNDNLSSLKLSATYTYDARYSITGAYFNVQGSTDPALYSSFLTGSPNTMGEIIDIGYSPFSRGGPAFWPWLNTRLGVQFTHYDKLNGASTGYALNPDGTLRNARDDNTTLLYAWTAF